jgi:hypothetical protein
MANHWLGEPARFAEIFSLLGNLLFFLHNILRPGFAVSNDRHLEGHVVFLEIQLENEKDGGKG